MKRCGICGGESGDRSQYCFQCGAPLADGSAGQGMPQTLPQSPLPGDQVDDRAAPGAGAGARRAAQPGLAPGGAPRPELEETQPQQRAPTLPAAPAQLVAGVAKGKPGEGVPETLDDPEEPAPKPPAPAAPPAAPAVPDLSGHVPPGTVVDGKYSIERVLGEGGMGVVYLAREIHTDGEVVLKAVQARDCPPQGRARADAGRGQGARAHRPHQRGPAQGRGGRGQGPVAGDAVRRGREPRADPRALRQQAAADARGRGVGIFRQIVAGVSAAQPEGLDPPGSQARQHPHSPQGRRGEGHRLRDRQGRGGCAGRPRSDPRLHRLAALHLARAGHAAGGISTGAWTSTRSASCSTRCWPGACPFDGDSAFEIMRLQAEAPMPRLSESRPDLPAALDEVIFKACAKERDNRFGSGDELVAAARGRGCRRPRSRPRCRRSWRGVAVAAAAPTGAPAIAPAASMWRQPARRCRGPVGAQPGLLRRRCRHGPLLAAPELPPGASRLRPMPRRPGASHLDPTGPHRDASYPPASHGGLRPRHRDRPSHRLAAATAQVPASPGSSGWSRCVVVGLGIGALLLFGVIPLPGRGPKSATGPDATSGAERTRGRSGDHQRPDRDALAAGGARGALDLRGEARVPGRAGQRRHARVSRGRSLAAQRPALREGRGALRSSPGVGSSNEFEVEDCIRPRPPQGSEYDLNAARATRASACGPKARASR